MTTPNMDAIRAFLADHGMPHLFDSGLMAAGEAGTLDEFLDQRGAGHLPESGLTRLLATGEED